MRYGFWYVLMVQKAQAYKLKPHLWNNDDMWEKISTLSTRGCQKSTFFEIGLEYPWKLFLLGHWYRKYKFFQSNPLFSSSPGFLIVLHLPSGDEIFFVDNPPCHTSKVASWHVDCRYELQFWSYLSKILSKSPKTGKIWHYCSNPNFSHVFQLLLNILPR